MAFTDTVGGGINTYSAHPQNGTQINSPGKKMWAAYSIIGTGSGSMAFIGTATGGTSGMSIQVNQFRGYLASPLDVTGSGTDSVTGTSHSLGSVTTTGNFETIVGCNIEIPVSAQTFTVGSGWTLGSQITSAANCPGMVQYQLGNAAGSYTNSYTTAVSTQDGGLVWAFRETGWASALILLGQACL
jgi:hypothetical protein